jgi:hypothetical protein
MLPLLVPPTGLSDSIVRAAHQPEEEIDAQEAKTDSIGIS